MPFNCLLKIKRHINENINIVFTACFCCHQVEKAYLKWQTFLLKPYALLFQAHSILSLLRAQTLFVTDRGRLVGLITWPEVCLHATCAFKLTHTHKCFISAYFLVIFLWGWFSTLNAILLFFLTRSQPHVDLFKLGGDGYLQIQSSLPLLPFLPLCLFLYFR